MPNKEISKIYVWLSDGSSFEERDWSQVPKSGIVMLLVLYADGVAQHFGGKDFYFYFPQRGIVGASSDARSVFELVPWVKFGSWTSREIIERAQDEAKEIATEWSREHGA